MSEGDAGARRGPPRFDDSLGAWIVTRYADAYRILNDDNVFSASAYGRLEPDVSGSHVFFLADERTHARLRRAFARVMTRTFIEDVTARVLIPAARSIVERYGESSSIDPVEDLTRPYCRATLFAITDIEPQIGDALVIALRVAHDYFAAAGSDSVDGWAGVHIARELAMQGLAGPGPVPWSLRSRLHGGGDLSAFEQVVCLMPLFDTLAVKNHRDLAASLLRRLAQLPRESQMKLLDEGLLPAAAEETVRLQSGGILPRTATREIEISGVRIPAGGLLLISLNDASTDPLEFSRPEMFDPTRTNLARHQGFGTGNRVCVGRQLAKALAVCLAEQTLLRWELSTISGSSHLATRVRQPKSA